MIDKTAAYWYTSPARFKKYEQFLQLRRNNLSRNYPDDFSSTLNMEPRSLKKFPVLKFIVIVCDPVQRALSHHEMFKYNNWANLDRQQAFNKTSKPNIFTNYGKYGSFTSLWLKHFSLSQFLFFDGHKFRDENPALSLKKVESFLGIKEHFRTEHFERRKEGRFFCHKSWFGCGPRVKGRWEMFLFPL